MSVVISAKDLVLSYGPNVALDQSSFEIERGTLTAIIGPNGSGKSTLLSALSGLLPPSGGTIRVHGDARIAHVLQATKVNEALPVTVRELVRMGRYTSIGALRPMRPADHRAVEEAMEDVGIADLAGKHLNELSAGQRQRVFLAQGIAQEHEVLLLDEPMTGLDLSAAGAIDRVVQHLRETGCTVVLTTHSLRTAAAADRVLLLAGRVITAGPPDVVLTPPLLRKAYGPGLVQFDADTDDVFVDDPAHLPVERPHQHRDRTIHVEGAETELHGG